MKIVKIVLIGVVVLIALLVAVGFLLPEKTHVERVAYIEVEPKVVYGFVSNFREFNKWSPWAKIDENTEFRFEGAEQGLGAVMYWSSEHSEVGRGRQEIIDAHPDRKVRVLLDFGSKGQAVTSYTIDKLEEGTHITWAFDTEHGDNIVSRYFGLLMDSMVGSKYEQGLKNLKRLAESQPPLAAPDVKTEEVSYTVGEASFNGYLAYDSQSDNGAAVLLVHDIWGANESIRKRAEMLAELGFTVFAVDMYGKGDQLINYDGLLELSKGVLANVDQNKDHLSAAIDVVKNYRKVTLKQFAAMGYGMGGSVLLDLINSDIGLDAAVSLYGHPSISITVDKIRTSYLVLNAAQDDSVTQEHLNVLFKYMDAAGIDYEFKDYPGVKRGFADPQSDQYAEKYNAPVAYNANADKDSWRMVRTFLARVLR